MVFRPIALSSLAVATGIVFTFGQSPIATAQSTSAKPVQVAQVPVGATVLYVNPSTGTDATGRGTAAAPLKTITYALEQISEGTPTVIQLATGQYSEQSGERFPLRLKSNVTLLGNEQVKGKDYTIVGGGEAVSATFARQNMTIWAVNNSTIRGVAVTNPAGRGTGVWVEAGTPVIVNSAFLDSGRDGVFITGTASPRIENNVFLRNSGNGIASARSASGVVLNNVFQANGFGIAVGDKATTRLESNQISNNISGIYINGTAQPVLRGNAIAGNQENGIVITVNGNPDLGTNESLGVNTIRGNNTSSRSKVFDVYNATSNTISAVGNDIDKISGPVNFTIAPTAPPTAGAFKDVPANYWAKGFIEELAKRDIISGFPDGTFKPDAPVTRAEFAALINKAYTPKAVQPAVNFSDVPSSFWGFSAIKTASEGGFMAGYPGGVFRPQENIPRVQIVVAIANGIGYGRQPADLNLLTKLTDGASVPDYAKNSVAAASQRSILVNYPTNANFAPNRQATRAEVAAMIYQSLVDLKRVPSIDSPYIFKP
jgi:parallel beta-helix repeat protein